MNPLVLALRELYDQNSVAKAVLNVLRNDYERNMTMITISTLAWRSGKTENEVKETCREFEKLRLGRYVPGRHKSPSRFEWAAKITEIGAVAAGEQDSFDEEFSFDEDSPTELTSNSTSMTDSSDESDGSNGHQNSGDRGIVHSFKLRPDFEVSFKLPVNFSKVEAARIAQFVASLPFES